MGTTGTGTARPEAWAKNVVAVGGISVHGTEDRAEDSSGAASYGPPLDGRIKPDLANVFDGVLAAGPTPTYVTVMGTSTSAAITSGAAGLIMQLRHQGAWAGHGGGASVFDDRPHGATARALLINGTYQYDWTMGGPNATVTRFKQGWGMPDVAALYQARATAFIVDQTDPLVAG
jgi:hypothetical protein